MSIYDRDYYRDDRRKTRRSTNPLAGFSAVGLIVLLNVAFFLVNGLFFSNNWLTEHMVMTSETLSHPAQWYRLLAYGFAHDPSSLNHILGNMITLFFLGRLVEMRYGKREFLLIYFLSVVLCGLVWGALRLGGGSNAAMLGASGAISTIVILFAMNFPRVQVLLFFFIPMPAWILGVLYIVLDAMGVLGGTSMVAHDVHLTGAAFAAVYFLSHMNFSRTLGRMGSRFGISRFKKKPSVRVVRPGSESSLPASMQEDVDRILRKITAQGERSLTDQERATLRRASEEYQRRNQ